MQNNLNRCSIHVCEIPQVDWCFFQMPPRRRRHALHVWESCWLPLAKDACRFEFATERDVDLSFAIYEFWLVDAFSVSCISESALVFAIFSRSISLLFLKIWNKRRAAMTISAALIITISLVNITGCHSFTIGKTIMKQPRYIAGSSSSRYLITVSKSRFVALAQYSEIISGIYSISLPSGLYV